MLAIHASTRCFVCLEPQDFRKGIDGIAAVVRQKIAHDPMSGAMYLFRNRSGTSIKILSYDGMSYWLCLRRLSTGRLRWWPKNQNPEQDHSLVSALSAREIQVVLWNGDPNGAQFSPDWKKLT
jgi:transposase